jgi:hypothetical protein
MLRRRVVWIGPTFDDRSRHSLDMTILEAKGVSAEGAPSLPLGALSRELPTRCHSRLIIGRVDGPLGVPVDDPASAWFMQASGSEGTMVRGHLEEPVAPGADRGLRSVETPGNHAGECAGPAKNGDTRLNAPTRLFSIAARWAT